MDDQMPSKGANGKDFARIEAWGIIPARGGSKGITLKNLFLFGGRPLMWYTANALINSNALSRIICSTDDVRIAEYCERLGVEVHNRPEHLSGDSTSVVAVIRHLLEDIKLKENVLPEIIVLGQPTSPFLMPEHVQACIAKMIENQESASCQTVVEVIHHNHYINQRVIENNYIRFIYEKERLEKYNKQKKEKTYALGNLVVTRVKNFFTQDQLFAQPSIPVIIHPVYGFDLDSYQDAELGECLLNHKLLQRIRK